MKNFELFSLDDQYSTMRLVSTKVPYTDKGDHCCPAALLLPFVNGRNREGGLRTKSYFKFSLPEKPLITVITVVFNGDKLLEETILSVINQDYDNVEYIIIDGGSTDSTLDIIGYYEHAIDYWISEPDKGIYDAMNKGISLVLGDYILFLGADDKLRDRHVLSQVSSGMVKQEPSLIFGSVIYEGKSSQNRQSKIINSKLDWTIFIHNVVHHQSCFYHRSIFSNWRYDSSLRLIADYELNLLIFKKKLVPVRIDLIVSSCEPYGASKSNFKLFKEETNLIRKRNVKNLALRSIVSVIFEIKSLAYLIKEEWISRMSK